MQLRDQLAITWARVAIVLGLAAIGGAVGASLMWVATGQLRLSGAFIGFVGTAIGWFISARLSERAQTRLFQHNIINTARLDLTREIREEQEWIGKLLGLGFLYRGALINRKNQTAPLEASLETMFWINQSREGHNILYRRQNPGRMLTMLLEEYELLFPETKRVRHQLDLPAFFGPAITGERRRSDRLVVRRVLPDQREPASPASAPRHLVQQSGSL